jgi:hypothetical protein
VNQQPDAVAAIDAQALPTGRCVSLHHRAVTGRATGGRERQSGGLSIRLRVPNALPPVGTGRGKV